MICILVVPLHQLLPQGRAHWIVDHSFPLWVWFIPPLVTKNLGVFINWVLPCLLMRNNRFSWQCICSKIPQGWVGGGQIITSFSDVLIIGLWCCVPIVEFPGWASDVFGVVSESCVCPVEGYHRPLMRMEREVQDGVVYQLWVTSLPSSSLALFLGLQCCKQESVMVSSK